MSSLLYYFEQVLLYIRVFVVELKKGGSQTAPTLIFLCVLCPYARDLSYFMVAVNGNE